MKLKPKLFQTKIKVKGKQGKQKGVKEVGKESEEQTLDQPRERLSKVKSKARVKGQRRRLQPPETAGAVLRAAGAAPGNRRGG